MVGLLEQGWKGTWGQEEEGGVRAVELGVLQQPRLSFELLQRWGQAPTQPLWVSGCFYTELCCLCAYYTCMMGKHLSKGSALQ